MTPPGSPPAEPDPDRLLAAALRQAATGGPVFPCVPDAKNPLTPHGFHDATIDPDRIRAWWQRTPTANVAMPTGQTSFDVLDVDVRPTGSGYPAYHRLHRAGLLDGRAQTVLTPNGGLHVYYPGTTQPSARLPEHHLDFKATGGYVLLPPSVVNGHGYELHRRDDAGHQPLDWSAVRDHLAPGPSIPRPGNQPTNIDALAAWVAHLPEGRRNDGTFWAACRATEQGHTNLTPIIAAAVRAGLPLTEATATVRSALRRASRPSVAPARPRQR